MSDQSENARLEAVQTFRKLNFSRSQELQEIVDLTAELCEKPVALVTLLDKELNWLLLRKGVDVEAMPRETSFCQFTVLQDDILIVPDATKDARFDNNPIVHQAPNVRFYAGAPLIIKEHLRIGALCVLDVQPGNLSALQQKVLSILSRQVTFLMELEISHQALHQQLLEITNQNKSLRRIAQIQSHEIRQPLTSIMGLLNTIREDKYVADKERLLMMEEAAIDLDRKIHAVVQLTKAYE